MRKLIVLLGLLLLEVQLEAIPLAAVQLPEALPEQGTVGSLAPCGRDHSGAAIVCNPQDVVEISGPSFSGVPASFGAGGGGSGIKYYAYDRLTTGPDGQACVATAWAAEGTTPRDRVRTDLVTQNVLDIHGLPLEYPPCPARPAVPGQPPQPATPSSIARRHWELVPLPQPRPHIPPGRAITGKLAYLDTGGAVTHRYSSDTVFGPLRIEANGSYMIAWGDGETSGPYSFEGEPCPTGRITHEYQRVGSYDIIVTERWTARWYLAGQTGNLRTLQTVGRINVFPVQQIQAVIG